MYAILQPQNGFLNTILNVFGIESINWYAEPNKWPAILTVTYVWKNVGMDSVIYYAAPVSYTHLDVYKRQELDHSET